jgi:processed acidic surface protein
MKRLLTSALLVIVLLQSFSGNVFAQPPQEELDQLLVEIGWDMENLTKYLDYYEESLADYNTIEELQEVLGTPITPDNLSELLVTHGMTREELDILLAEFGETVHEDYFFIEDLELAIGFYQDHDEMMQEYEEFLSAIGITEEEADRLFNHFEALDQEALQAQMEQVGARLENLMMIDPEAEITDEQKAELVAVWEEIMASVQLKAKYYLVDAQGNQTPISFSELANMENFTAAALLVELYNLDGMMILDLQASGEMLDSQFAIDAGEKLTDIGELAGELTELKHEKLPDTASPYVANMLVGIGMVLIGISLVLYRRKRVVR